MSDIMGKPWRWHVFLPFALKGTKTGPWFCASFFFKLTAILTGRDVCLSPSQVSSCCCLIALRSCEVSLGAQKGVYESNVLPWWRPWWLSLLIVRLYSEGFPQGSQMHRFQCVHVFAQRRKCARKGRLHSSRCLSEVRRKPRCVWFLCVCTICFSPLFFFLLRGGLLLVVSLCCRGCGKKTKKTAKLLLVAL